MRLLPHVQARALLAGPPRLTRLHRAHLLSITWEAIDCFMGWPTSVDPAAAHAKIVQGGRGGWCYEMNGLFGAALAALGFRVTRLAGCVDLPQLGGAAIGNHLTLRVDLDRPYLAEVGVADALSSQCRWQLETSASAASISTSA